MRLLKVLSDEGDGNGIDQTQGQHKTLKECEHICDTERLCNSFSYSEKQQRCWFKTKKVKGTELQKEKEDWFTVFKICGLGNYDSIHQETKNIFLSSRVFIVSINYLCV